MSASERILFMRRLSLFLRAGISIHTSLELIRESARRRAHARMVSMLAADVLEGRRLSVALTRFPRIFDALSINLVQVGETSGTLPEHLEQIAEISTSRREEQQRMLGIAAYPAIIVLFTIALILFLTFFAFPKILPLIRSLHTKLPIPTRILIGTTSFIAAYGWVSALTLVLFIALSIYTLRFHSVQLLRDNILMRTPVFGALIKHSYAASVTRTLSILLKSGVGILPALELLADGTRHRLYRAGLLDMSVRVREGQSVAQAFSEHPMLFPGTVVQLVYAGELTGTLPDSLRGAAQIYQQYLQEQVRFLGTLVEPVLMISMGCIVGFVALAIIMPIYKLTQAL